jgi:hypothetical protein
MHRAMLHPAVPILGILWASCCAVAAASEEPEVCSDQVTYRSDFDPSYRYLEERQRSIYAKNPGFTDALSRRELNSPRAREKWEEFRKRVSESCPALDSPPDRCGYDPRVAEWMIERIRCSSLPTRFESPLFFVVLGVYMDELDRIRMAHFPGSAAARFGSLPTGTIDAQAILPPGSKTPIVIVNRDVLYFTQRFSASVVNAIPIVTNGDRVDFVDSEEGIRNRLRDNPEIVADFADAMSRMVRFGSPDGANAATLDAIHDRIVGLLKPAMDMFILAHEEAHVILGHVNDEPVPLRLGGARRPLPDTGASSRRSRPEHGDDATTVLVQFRTRQQELAADAL